MNGQMNKRGREVLSYSRVLINAEEMKRIITSWQSSQRWLIQVGILS